MRRTAGIALALAALSAPAPATAATAPAVPSNEVIAPPDAATFGYATPTVVIPEGGTLGFAAVDVLPHTVTSEAVDATGAPLFASNTSRLGSQVTVNGVSSLAPGQYAFYCTIHPNMKGTLIVQGAPLG